MECDGTTIVVAFVKVSFFLDSRWTVAVGVIDFALEKGKTSGG